ncbi:MAG: hypothetical protein ACO23V_06000 [Chitinophagaceae bacterium]|jgi:hypothetical protein
MDYNILELFIKENHAWDHMINRQRVELPQLDAMISNSFEEGRGKLRDQSVRVLHHLKKGMEEQRQSMDEVARELASQQAKLTAARDRKTEIEPYSTQTLNNQNVLRSRIRDIEKKFVELKCNYFNYVATI